MSEAKPSKPSAKAAAEDLRSKLGAAMAKSPPPPAVQSALLPAAAPSPPPAAPSAERSYTRDHGRSKLTTIGVPVHDLTRSDEIAAWLQKQTGERGIGAATVVRALLRAAKLDPALVAAFRTVRAEDGRRRR